MSGSNLLSNKKKLDVNFSFYDFKFYERYEPILFYHSLIKNIYFCIYYINIVMLQTQIFAVEPNFRKNLIYLKYYEY